MAVENLKEKLARIVSKENSNWIENAKWRAENQTWLKRSQDIAIKILDRLEELDIFQAELAKRIGVTPQHISQIVKGKENLTLETIAKLEQALGIDLIAVSTSQKYIIRAMISPVSKKVNGPFLSRTKHITGKTITEYFDVKQIQKLA